MRVDFITLKCLAEFDPANQIKKLYLYEKPSKTKTVEIVQEDTYCATQKKVFGESNGYIEVSAGAKK